jgi:hypothetical protein
MQNASEIKSIAFPGDCLSRRCGMNTFFIFSKLAVIGEFQIDAARRAHPAYALEQVKRIMPTTGF